ncbi:phosphate signaling complex protein PhoU [Metasolibacillus sp. FSL H7-0170]|uniref:phosphate signaling complex protein PhoU n=1 Tax=Metasolibacillus TaxID=2703677 RepID=UPI000793340A|nr:phosphate signaling complex protein PhoU [Metasolibacillus fluoroglycofenilyticus]KYG92436.1 phosphate transport system regulatory protein PhoU [[Bacillus] sp. KCTC 13219]
MAVRERFEHDMKTVQEDLLDLCNKSIEALEISFKAFVNKDIDRALSVIDNDIHINRLEEMINDRVILLIAKQQPVATDLRRLMTIVKAASDMERVGDYAVNIAKDTIRIGKDEFITNIEILEEMSKKTVSMLRQIVDAFIHENTSQAKEIAELDDKIDGLYGQAITGFMQLSSKHPDNISQFMYLSFVSRYLERSADHATNVAEHLFYLVKGQHYELNN